jgi:hypothetical protein
MRKAQPLKASLVGFAKTLALVAVLVYAVCVAVDHNQLREMRRQVLMLEIELFELLLSKAERIIHE